MLDGVGRKLIDPALRRAGRAIASAGITANQVTIAALILGLVAAALIAHGQMMAGLTLIIISRIGDGLDGAVANVTGKTDFGGFLDIVLDFVFYGAIPFAFVLYDPEANAIAGAALIFAFYINGASFLTYAIVAEKRDLETDTRGPKTIYFTTGLAEASETYLVFVAFCIWPEAFSAIAWVFAGICLYTALTRTILARRNFAPKPTTSGWD